MKKPREIFFSHASIDRVAADKIVFRLRRVGLRVWYSKTHLKGAQQWQAEIGAALKRCDWFVVLLSPAAVKSKWVERELAYALQHDQYDRHIVPLLLRGCNYERLSWTLGAIQMIDSTKGPEAGADTLLKLWGPKKIARRR
jgi:hypothetical protein